MAAHIPHAAGSSHPDPGKMPALCGNDELHDLAKALERVTTLVGDLASTVALLANINKGLHHRLEQAERQLGLDIDVVPVVLDTSVLDRPGWENRLQ